MGLVMERWCPTQQMLGVFLRRNNMRKMFFVVVGIALAIIAALASLALTRTQPLEDQLGCRDIPPKGRPCKPLV